MHAGDERLGNAVRQALIMQHFTEIMNNISNMIMQLIYVVWF
jgi:hypothetical protein